MNHIYQLVQPSHHFPVLSVFSHGSCHLIFCHIFPGVVEPSPSRQPSPSSLPHYNMHVHRFSLDVASSLILMWPCQFNIFCLRNVDIWPTLASSCMTWFLTWSFLRSPLIHRSIHNSDACTLFSSFFLIAQHSAPYVIVGLITVLSTLSFSLIGTVCLISHLSFVSISPKLVSPGCWCPTLILHLNRRLVLFVFIKEFVIL